MTDYHRDDRVLTTTWPTFGYHTLADDSDPVTISPGVEGVVTDTVTDDWVRVRFDDLHAEPLLVATDEVQPVEPPAPRVDSAEHVQQTAEAIMRATGATSVTASYAGRDRDITFTATRDQS